MSLRETVVTGEDSMAPPVEGSGRQKVTPEVLDEVTVVLPALNEEKGLSGVIEKVQGAGFSKIIVLDGNSSDRTAEIARERGVQLVTQHGRGKTEALDTSLGIVQTKYLAIIDADDSYEPSDILPMLEQIRHADQVIGSRFLAPWSRELRGERAFPRGHGFGNKLVTSVFNLFFGTHLTDVLSGIRLLRTSVAKEIRFTSTGFGAEAELTAQFLMSGRKVVETPASYRRRVGDSKLGYADGVKILSTTAKLAYEYNPLAFFVPVGAALMVPGLALLGYVYYVTKFTAAHTFLTPQALGGIGLFLTGLQLMGLGAISFLFKRIEARQLRALRGIQERLAGET